MSYTVAGMGELLWDVFPEDRRLGGAPINFACHCRQLGAEAYPVSCVGDDDLGMDLLNTLTELNVDSRYVSKDAAHPTGTVQVTLDPNGKPSYEICEGVAWDYIPFGDKLEALALKADAVCFGSLCQRFDVSRVSIQRFLKSVRPEALKIFDVNLRQTFFNKTLVEESLALATILKLSDEELPVLSEMFDLSGLVENQLRSLLETFGLQLVAYTRGSKGSLLLTPGDRHDHTGNTVEVADSVGAGDSFTAALCIGLLHQKILAQINDHANQVAAFVCTQTGATPTLPSHLTG